MDMNKKILMLGAASLFFAGYVLAAPTEEEISRLGNDLTPFGAIKAGNAEGTVPAWDGGVCTPPASYKPIMGAKGGSPYADLFPDEKPLFSITSTNLDQYRDKLDLGTQELFKRNPETFRVDVYPT